MKAKIFLLLLIPIAAAAQAPRATPAPFVGQPWLLTDQATDQALIRALTENVEIKNYNESVEGRVLREWGQAQMGPIRPREPQRDLIVESILAEIAAQRSQRP